MKIGVLLAILFASLTTALPASNELTAAEKKHGWRLLFNGVDLTGWKCSKNQTAPDEKWKVVDGWLQCLGKGGGDIITTAAYEEFELSWEWKIEKGGNSGVKYFITPERGTIGHEYQLLDDATHPDAKLANGKRLTGAFYDVLKCQRAAPVKQPMEVNRSRIVVRDNQVEHWLNGTRLLTYQLSSERLKNAVSHSKFKDVKDFGTPLRGHILLQDHQSLVWFRNVKIREL